MTGLRLLYLLTLPLAMHSLNVVNVSDRWMLFEEYLGVSLKEGHITPVTCVFCFLTLLEYHCFLCFVVRLSYLIFNTCANIHTCVMCGPTAGCGSRTADRQVSLFDLQEWLVSRDMQWNPAGVNFQLVTCFLLVRNKRKREFTSISKVAETHWFYSLFLSKSGFK